ncbi:phosphate ABC transporter permease, partial [Pseudomonas syringae pv. actinidiae ICMP 18804]
MLKRNSLKSWFKSGAPGVWMSAGAVSIAVIMTIGLL